MNGGWRLEFKLCSKPYTTSPPERIRPRDLQKIINSSKLRESCGIYGIPNEYLSHLPRRPLVYLTHLVTAFGCPIFENLGRKQKS
jgi:hypothetical protein